MADVFVKQYVLYCISLEKLSQNIISEVTTYYMGGKIKKYKT